MAVAGEDLRQNLLFWVFDSPEWLILRLGRITRAVAQDAAMIDLGREVHDKPLTMRDFVQVTARPARRREASLSRSPGYLNKEIVGW